jgi:AcrR family transcriptional regulator
MREVAKQIGYSATTIYLYFADKESLMRAVCDADFLKLADTLKGLLDIQDPMQRLIAFGQGYVNFALTYPNHYRMMFMTAHPPCSPEVSQIQQNNAEQDAYFQLLSVTQAAFDAQMFRDDFKDPILIAQTIWAAMHGLCALHITMAQDTWIAWRPLQKRIETMMTMTMQGMAKQPFSEL